MLFNSESTIIGVGISVIWDTVWVWFNLANESGLYPESLIIFPLLLLKEAKLLLIAEVGPVTSPIPACAESAGIYPKISVISVEVTFKSVSVLGTSDNFAKFPINTPESLMTLPWPLEVITLSAVENSAAAVTSP